MTSTNVSAMPEYEAEESPPPLTALALGAQSAALVVAPIALFPIVLFQAVEGSESELAWAVFAMLAVNGVTTVLQALARRPPGRQLC